jgi:hypothetical protein
MAVKVEKASDCKCCVCGKPAVAFWPCIDPDIPSEPYCRKCLDKAKAEVIMAIWMDDCK